MVLKEPFAARVFHFGTCLYDHLKRFVVIDDFSDISSHL
jgi:hypothetical protein